MTRPATSRPLGEHLALLARMLRQIDCNRGLSPADRRKIKTALSTCMSILQKAMVKS